MSNPFGDITVLTEQEAGKLYPGHFIRVSSQLENYLFRAENGGYFRLLVDHHDKSIRVFEERRRADFTSTNLILVSNFNDQIIGASFDFRLSATNLSERAKEALTLLVDELTPTPLSVQHGTPEEFDKLMIAISQLAGHRIEIFKHQLSPMTLLNLQKNDQSAKGIGLQILIKDAIDWYQPISKHFDDLTHVDERQSLVPTNLSYPCSGEATGHRRVEIAKILTNFYRAAKPTLGEARIRRRVTQVVAPE